VRRLGYSMNGLRVLESGADLFVRVLSRMGVFLEGSQLGFDGEGLRLRPWLCWPYVVAPNVLG